MKNLGRIFIILFIIMYYGFSNAFAEAYPNEPDGFRGIMWGTDINTLKGMKLVFSHPKNKDVKYYRRNKDKLTLGAAKLKQVYYIAWRNKFSVVHILFDGKKSGAAMKDVTFMRFGTGKQDNSKYGEMRYFWEGEKAYIILAYDTYGIEDGFLLIGSADKIQEIMGADQEKIRRKEDDELRKAKEGSKKDF